MNQQHSDEAESNALIFTFLAPTYPITTDIMHNLCQDCGTVLRIIIIKNTNVQAIVEFDSVTSARKAKGWFSDDSALPGHCILSIEYSKETPLKIWKNDQFTHDFTNPNPEYTAEKLSPVMVVEGLNPGKVNADRLFNLLCLYGNVEKVKLLKSKPGMAYVEMGDSYSVERVITHLNNAVLFGEILSISASKDHNVYPSRPFELVDGTSSYKTYHRSRNNRFTTPEQAAKNHIVKPSKVLYFFTAQPNISNKSFNQIFNELSIKPAGKMKFYQKRTPGKKITFGFLEWDTLEDSMEALATMNNYKMENPSGTHPFTINLAFSSSETISP